LVKMFFTEKNQLKKGSRMTIASLVNFVGYKVTETIKNLETNVVLIAVEAEHDHMECVRCGHQLTSLHGRHRIRAKFLPIFNYESYVTVWRRKGSCSVCKKIRSEKIHFLSKDSPHLTSAYESTIEELTEIAPASRVADFTGEDKSTVWRLDFRRLLRLKRSYKTPKVTHISVDEVYARKSHGENETRNDRFFTVITDMKSKKVIWVEDSRRKEGLDNFYKVIGKEACSNIQVVAQDQHEDYLKSTMEHCPQAKIVYDKFHVIKSFNEALNECRKLYIKMFDLSKSEKKKLSGDFKFVLSKRASKRSEYETDKLSEATRNNKIFLQLELIKESVLHVFGHGSVADAKKQFEQTGQWIKEAGFPPLKNWFRRLQTRWHAIEAYYDASVTSAICEGINNVIKAVKRRAFGYKNMEYFKLKIMQVCGFLSSKYRKLHEDHESIA